jgi:hypothetical protein
MTLLKSKVSKLLVTVLTTDIPTTALESKLMLLLAQSKMILKTLKLPVKQGQKTSELKYFLEFNNFAPV